MTLSVWVGLGVRADMPNQLTEKQIKLRAKWSRSYYRNREKKLARSADYRARNLDIVRKRRRDWQSQNWTYRQEYMRNYYAANREKIKKASRHNYRENRQSRALITKNWQARNSEKVKRYHAKYREKIKTTGYHKKWRDKNRGKWTAMSSRRRALERNAAINLRKISEWMQFVRNKDYARCYYCKTEIPSNEVHFDHIVAIIKGGQHSVENLCVSCRKCNLSKGAKDLSCWMKSGQLMLSL